MNPDLLAEVREWVGSSPDDAEIEDAYGRTGSVHGAALAILRTRRADLLTNPAKWSVVGEYIEELHDLKFLDDQIAVLEGLTGSTGVRTVTTSRLVRCDTGR